MMKKALAVKWLCVPDIKITYWQFVFWIN